MLVIRSGNISENEAADPRPSSSYVPPGMRILRLCVEIRKQDFMLLENPVHFEIFVFRMCSWNHKDVKPHQVFIAIDGRLMYTHRMIFTNSWLFT